MKMKYYLPTLMFCSALISTASAGINPRDLALRSKSTVRIDCREIGGTKAIMGTLYSVSDNAVARSCGDSVQFSGHMGWHNYASSTGTVSTQLATFKKLQNCVTEMGLSAYNHLTFEAGSLDGFIAALIGNSASDYGLAMTDGSASYNCSFQVNLQNPRPIKRGLPRERKEF
jgi:hypothetical protein